MKNNDGKLSTALVHDSSYPSDRDISGGLTSAWKEMTVVSKKGSHLADAAK